MFGSTNQTEEELPLRKKRKLLRKQREAREPDMRFGYPHEAYPGYSMAHPFGHTQLPFGYQPYQPDLPYLKSLQHAAMQPNFTGTLTDTYQNVYQNTYQNVYENKTPAQSIYQNSYGNTYQNTFHEVNQHYANPYPVQGQGGQQQGAYQQPALGQNPYNPYPNPYPKQVPYTKQQNSAGLQSVVSQFKKADGQMDFNKMVDTAGQMMSAVNQMSSLVKGVSSIFKV
ncbi:YppG family protein [Metabacillus sp. RGM 3146]|uniref:YppG family protein n=1 Tax=Metabacillus sp. RGM 3146 TaxID=3401092 RepID=UPI003B990F43